MFFLQVSLLVFIVVLLLHRLKKVDEKRPIVLGESVAGGSSLAERERERQHKLTLSAAIKGFVRGANKKRQLPSRRGRDRLSEISPTNCGK